MGMVHQVVPAAEIESTTMALARTIAGHAPLSLTGIKASLLRAVSLRDQVDHRDIDELARQAHQSADAAEGRQAMLEKRPPVFRGK
jgi:enoyl-CoA hydratase/carnithine racemase